MDQWRTIRWGILVLSLMLIWACDEDSGNTDDAADGGGDLDTSTETETETQDDTDSQTQSQCRGLIAEAVATFDGKSEAVSCLLTHNPVEHKCELGTGAEKMVIATQYASLEDVVAEGQTMGKVLAISDWVKEPGSDRKTTTYMYDEQRRLKMSVESRAEEVITSNYSNYDDAGRPLQALMSWDDCAGLPVEFRYDDVNLTKTITYKPDGTGDCEYDLSTDLETFDEHGNRIKIEEGGDEPRVVVEIAVTRVETVCI